VSEAAQKFRRAAIENVLGPNAHANMLLEHGYKL
jgi:hypothetical protein